MSHAAILDAPEDEVPPVFLKYQQNFMNSVSHYAVTVWEKSRRTGFSWATAGLAALTASAAKDAGGMDVLYIGYNKEMAREFIDYVGEWARQFSIAAGEMQEEIFDDPEHPEKSIKIFRVDFAGGFKVLALPSVPRALRGMQGLVIIDEAAFHDDLEGVMKAAMALTIWGGKVVVISTHDGDANYFNTLVTDIRAGRLPYHLGRTTFDDALEDGLYKRICLVSGKKWSEEAEAAWRAEIVGIYGANADEELFVVPSAGSGAYLPAALIEARMDESIPVIRLELPASFLTMREHLRVAEINDWCRAELLPILETLDPKTPHCLGEDFGRNRDLTVLWPLAIERNLFLRTPFILEMRNVPFEAQKQIVFYIIDRLPLFRAGKFDARGNGQYLAEVAMQRYGARIEQVMLSEPWYQENSPRFKAQFEDGTISLPKDREILDDHRLAKLIRGIGRIPDERTGDKGNKRHGDSFVAGVLAVAASRAPVMEYGYEPVPRTGVADPRVNGQNFFGTAEEANRAQDEAEKSGGIFPEFGRRIY